MALNFDDGQSVYDDGSSAWDGAAQFAPASAIGSQADCFVRLKTLFPPSWFKSSPNFDATLQGAAWALSQLYALAMYARQQMRIATAADSFLDIVSTDYFGAALPRLTQEGDASFRSRILANLFVRGPARRDMAAVLQRLTGQTPAIFEPGNATDSGGYDGGAFFDVAGAWGDPLPYQAFVTARRPAVSDTSLGEYDTPREWLDAAGYYSDAQPESVSDAAIAAAVESTRPLGTIVWLQIADKTF